MVKPEEFDKKQFDKEYALRKDFESRLEGDTDGDMGLFLAAATAEKKITPENFKKKPEEAAAPTLRLIEYDDPAGKPQAVFIALNDEEYGVLLEHPTHGLATYAEKIVHRVEEGKVSAQDHEKARAAFRSQYPAAGAQHSPG